MFVGLKTLPRMNMSTVRSLTSTRDNVNLKYICGCKSYLTSRFYGVELDLKSFSSHGIRTIVRNKASLSYISECKLHFTS